MATFTLLSTFDAVGTSTQEGQHYDSWTLSLRQHQFGDPASHHDNCSICRRYGALWGYFTQPEVKVIDQGAGLEQYVWGDQCIEFQRCKGCGCVTHYTAAPGTGSERLAVNYRMFDSVVQQALTIRHFDGADSWRYLD
ncbi:hypothetical protein ACOLXF_000007 [Vibrio fluvialis]